MIASDEMAEAAEVAAEFATALGYHLHGAASGLIERPARAEQLRKALRHWGPLQNAMKQLEVAAPNTFALVQSPPTR